MNKHHKVLVIDCNRHLSFVCHDINEATLVTEMSKRMVEYHLAKGTASKNGYCFDWFIGGTNEDHE